VGHDFLSDSWFAEVDKLREAAQIEVPAAMKDLVINVHVLGGPSGDVEARMAEGGLLKGFGAEAPTKLKIPYDIARKMIVEQDQNAAMQAFMGGQIQVEGDMSKLMSMQGGGPPSDASKKLADQIKGITD
jgi:hypothetical protein